VYTIQATGIVNLLVLGRLTQNFRGIHEETEREDPSQAQRQDSLGGRTAMKKLEKVATSLLFAIVVSGGNSKIH
jgi:hypothetical protein